MKELEIYCDRCHRHMTGVQLNGPHAVDITTIEVQAPDVCTDCANRIDRLPQARVEKRT